MNTLKIIIPIISLAIVSNYGVVAWADLNIYRDSSTGNKNQLNYVLKPGDSLKDKIKLVNMDEPDKQLQLSAKDAMITQDGSFTLQPASSENKLVGSWITLPYNKISISSGGTSTVEFNIAIPKNIQPGEYAGGIAATELTKSSKTVNVAKRKGIRIYITIVGDLSVTGEATNLRIINPTASDFKADQKKYYFAGKNNIVATFLAENKGNTYEILEAHFELRQPDGSIVTKQENYELAPSVGPHEYFVILNVPYKSGGTKLSMKWNFRSKNYDPVLNLKNEDESYKTILPYIKNVEPYTGNLQAELKVNTKQLNIAPKASYNAQIHNGESDQPDEDDRSSGTKNPQDFTYYSFGLAGILILSFTVVIKYILHWKRKK